MKLVLQRVKQAAVQVEGETIGQIGPGLLILAGVEKGDSADTVSTFSRKVIDLRIFEDGQGKMNRSILDIQGEVLLVSQFTLAADLQKGNRPGFTSAESPEAAELLLTQFSENLRQAGLTVAEGKFGASMQVTLTNDGPVTFII